MTIYVDTPAFSFRGQKYCHMLTDGDIEELHALAKKIGLRRDWFQVDASYPHYDLAPNKREQAIKLGAVEVSACELVEIIHKERKRRLVEEKSNADYPADDYRRRHDA